MTSKSGSSSQDAASWGAMPPTHLGAPEWLATALAALAARSDDLIALVDFEGRLLFVNPAGFRWLGLDDAAKVIGRPLADFLPPEAARQFEAVELPSARRDGRWLGESQLRDPVSGEPRNVTVNSFVVEVPAQRRPLCLVTVRSDVTEDKRREESLRTSEERFRQLAENIEEVFWISEIDPRKVLYVSPAFEAIFDTPCQELYDDPNAFLKRIHPEDMPRVLESLPRVREGGYDETFRTVRPDGTVRIIRSRGFPVRDAQGQVYRVAGIASDITQIKQVEEELLAERRFLQHLLAVQEGERKLVAYDIHDGFVQGVIGAVMHLEGLAADPELSKSAVERLNGAIGLLRHAIDEARRMISGLRPSVLDKQGLVAGIEFLISQRHDAPTQIEFVHDDIDARLDPIIEGTLYRIVQEALSNVFRHSQAKTATVSLTRQGEGLALVVEDQGVGFDPQKASPRQFGLRGIRERAQLCGGKATIESQPGRGTRIRIELPLSQAQAPSER